jgi:serine/threonine protein kinase
MMHSWEIEGSELVFLEEVGQGASAHVFKGKYRGQQVAIKVLKASVNPEEFKKEFEIMSDIRSPMVVFFYGAVTRPDLSIVTEFLSRGSLYDVMCSPVRVSTSIIASILFGWKLQLGLIVLASCLSCSRARRSRSRGSWR